jgi:hypothetical protein
MIRYEEVQATVNVGVLLLILRAYHDHWDIRRRLHSSSESLNISVGPVSSKTRYLVGIACCSGMMFSVLSCSTRTGERQIAEFEHKFEPAVSTSSR